MVVLWFISLIPMWVLIPMWAEWSIFPGKGESAEDSLIVRGGGGCGGGGGAPEPRQDVAEAVVAVQLGLALGALDRALEAAAEEARDPEGRGG